MSAPEADLRLYYAREVEAALVSALWHHPLHLGEVLRTLEPLYHIATPAYRYLLEAINQVYREMNATDWALVIDCLRDLGLLAECGGLLVLDKLYANPGYESLIGYYLELLDHYAACRGARPPLTPSFWRGGKGLLAPNKARTKPAEPEISGSARIAGVSYRISGWNATSPQNTPEVRISFSPL